MSNARPSRLTSTALKIRAAAVKTRAEQRTAQRLAQRRVVLIPDDRRTHPPSIEALRERAWFCLYVAPCREQAVRAELMRAGLPVYLPVSTYWSTRRCRTKRQLERALLTRYLFVGCDPHGSARISDEDWSKIRGVEGIQEILGDKVTELPLTIPTDNLVEFADQQLAGAWDETRATFDAQQTVRITRGPLAGFSGLVEYAVHKEAAPDDPISIITTLLGRQTVARIPLADLERVS